MNAVAEDRRFSLYRRAGAGRFPPPTVLADPGATSDEPERQIMLPGGGLAGAAEDPAFLFYAGLKRETPDRPEPGVPQVFSEESAN